MTRMTQRNKTSLLVATLAAIFAASLALPASAQMVRHADIDFEASGFVTPAGMVPPSMYQGGVQQVANQMGQQMGHDMAFGPPSGQPMYGEPMPGQPMYGQPMPGQPMPGQPMPGQPMYGQPMPGQPMMLGDASGGYYDGGYYGGAACDSGYCDSPGGCDGMCGSEGCCGGLFEGGLLGKLREHGCGNCLSRLCLFCRGGGCSACQGLKQNCASWVKCCLPYTEAGICAQRWYDLSIEGVLLGHSSSSQSGVLTTDGIDGIPVLGFDSVDVGDSLEGGVRVSGSVIFGVGANLELIYMGGQEWSDHAVARPDPIDSPTLYSFISEFGLNPEDGFDDTDRSLGQSLEASSDFHSAEWNYRRRSVTPCCRFQGSWLVGLRYLRFDSRLIYSARGEDNNTVNEDLPRFFSSNDKVKNNLFGPQAGFDWWWNVCPGINLGFGMKGAWVQNDAKRQTVLTGNSLDPLATPGTIVVSDTERFGTVIGELEATMIYRFSHSWSVRSSYYLIGVDDVVFGTVDGQLARDFITVSPLTESPFNRESLVVQGLSLGTEYIW